MMKTKNLFYLFLTSIILLTGFSSCNDGDDMLYLGISSVHAKLGEDLPLYIYSGNGGYELSVDNESVITASVDERNITVKPLTKGKTVLTVTDSKDQVAKVSIEVIDPYLAFEVLSLELEINNDVDPTTKDAIQDDIEKSAILVKAQLYDFIKTSALSFNVHKQSWGSSPVSTGNYTFEEGSIKLKSSNIEVTYVIEENADGKAFYDYFVSGKSPLFSDEPIFKLTADLTDKYKELYPDKNIESVSVVSAVWPYPYRLIIY